MELPEILKMITELGALGLLFYLMKVGLPEIVKQIAGVYAAETQAQRELFSREMTAQRGAFKDEMTAQREVFKSEMGDQRQAFRDELQATRQDRMAIINLVLDNRKEPY